MDGFTPLVLDDEQQPLTTPAQLAEPGEWLAVRAGDSALIVWFPAAE